jgi:hypothetical protein
MLSFGLKPHGDKLLCHHDQIPILHTFSREVVRGAVPMLPTMSNAVPGFLIQYCEYTLLEGVSEAFILLYNLIFIIRGLVPLSKVQKYYCAE